MPSPRRRSSRACPCRDASSRFSKGRVSSTTRRRSFSIERRSRPRWSARFSWGESIVRFFIDAGIGCARRTARRLADHPRGVSGPRDRAGRDAAHARRAVRRMADRGDAPRVGGARVVAGGLYVQQKLSVAVGPASRLTDSDGVGSRDLPAQRDGLPPARRAVRIAARRAARRIDHGRSRASVSIITTLVVAVRIDLGSAAHARANVDARRYGRLGPPSWQAVTVISWTSMRGVVSLATALALPRTLATGAPFPYRTRDHSHHDVRDRSHAGRCRG